MSFFKHEPVSVRPGAAGSAGSTAKRFLVILDRLRGIALILAALATIGLSAPGLAAKHPRPPAAPLSIQPTISWVATGDGFWDVASNWRDTNNVARVPTATDDVLINGAATNTVTIRSGQSVRSLLATESLAITAGSLTVGAASELDARFTLSNAGLVANGVLTLVGNSQISSGTILGSASLNNAGTMTLSGSGDVLTLGTVLNNTGTIAHASGVLSFRTDFALGTLNNSGLYDLQSDNVGLTVNVFGSSINNSGTFRKSGGSGTVTVGLVPPFNNNGGTIDVESGTLSLASGTHTGGVFTAGAGATLLFTNVHTFTGTYTGSGQGTVLLAGSQFLVGSSPATFNLSGSLLQWQSGRIKGGAAGLANVGTMTLVPGGGNTIFGGRIDNAGTFIQSGLVPLDLESATFTNLAGAVFDFQGDGTVFFIQAGDRFINRGTVRKSLGTYSTFFSAPPGLVNTSEGTVEVLSGTLGIFTASNEGGTFIVAAGAILDLTDGLNHGGGGGGNPNYKGSYTGSGQGTVLLAGNSLTIDPAGATFKFPPGLFQWTGGAILGGAPGLTNAGTITLSGSGTKFLGGVLNNAGTIVHKSGALQVDDGTLNNNALYDVQGDVTLQRQFLVPALFNNAGTFRKSAGTGTLTGFALPFSNTGTVEIRSGTFAFVSTSVIQQISGTTLTGGTWNVFANSTLTLQSITCPGGGANCALTTNQANITLNGFGATFTNISGLTSNAGNLSVLGGRSFTTTSSLSNTGLLTIGPGSALNVTGSYSQTAAASLSVQIDGRPANGRFGRLTSSGNASLDGTLNVALVNGFGPTSGDIYPVMTFASHSGAFSTITGLNAGSVPLFRADLLSTSLTLTTLESEADLALKAVNILTATAKPGQNVSIGYTVDNLGGVAAMGDWYDLVYLSATPFVDASAVLLGTVHHIANVAGLASYTETLTAPLPPLLPRGYRAVVTADSRKLVPDVNRANNTGASPGTLAVTIPLLVLGTPLTDTIAANQDSYYHLIVPPGADVTLSAKYTVASQAELYVRFGALPDRTTFDLSTLGNLANTSPVLALTNTLGGDYYILVHGLAAAGAGQSFTLTASSSAFALIDFTPKISLNRPDATIDVTGTKFSATTTVSLIAANAAVLRPTSMSFIDSGHVEAAFDLSAVPLGDYAVRADDGSQTSTASTLFKVTNIVVGNYSGARILTPARVRVGNPIPMTVDIHGLINSITPVPFVQVDATNVESGQARQQFVDPQLPDFIGPGGSLQFGFVYHPEPKASGVVSGFDLSLISLAQAIDWDGQKDKLRPSGVPADAWDAVWANLRPRLKFTVGDFYAVLKRDSLALAQIEITTNSVNRLFAFELSMANDQLPLPNLATAADVAFPAPGLPLSFGRTFLSSSLTGRFRLGRLGRGWVDNFDVTVTTDTKNKLVAISNGSATRAFLIKADGTYAALPGDSGSLTQVAGAYQLRERNGALIAFRSDGSIDYIQDINHNRITAGYTGTQLTSLTHSNGSKLTLAYNAEGRISQVTDPAGRVATYLYDSTGEQLVNVSTARGSVGYAYTAERSGPHAFALASITTPAGRHAFFDYDAQGRLKSRQSDGGAQAVTYSYDVTTIRVTDANSHAATMLYDDVGRVVATRDALGHAHATDFDDLNHVTAVAAQGGGVATMTYDTEGYVTGATDPLGARPTLAYEPTFHQLTGWSDALGNSTAFSYDASGNLTLSAHADGSTNQYSYDSNGNLIRSVDRNGRMAVFTYDSHGLVTSIELAGGSRINYTYDAHANPISAGDSAGTTAIQYDAADRLTRLTYPNGRFLAYRYDADGRRTQSVDQTGFTVNYGFDAAGRLATLTDAVGDRMVEYTYDAAGQLRQADNGNGTSTHYDYDDNGQLLHQINFGPGNVVNSRFDYAYDVVGRRSTVTTLDGTSTYGYDGVNRLTSVTLPNGRSLTYVYDAAGNRIGVTDNGVATAYTTNNLNQYTSIGAEAAFYDLAGNLTSMSGGQAGNVSYAYDALNRLVSVTNASGTWTYEYDALGHRVATTHQGQRTEYLVDPVGLGSVTAEFSASGQLLAHYTYGLCLASRVDAANTVAYYDFDGVGSTIGITGTNGAYVNRYAYLPFGERVLSSEAVANPFQFSGRYGVLDDGSGLNHMRARFYDPAQGRFTQSDPIGVAGGTNLYAYARNNPVGNVDPSGLVVPISPLAITLSPFATTLSGEAALANAATLFASGVSPAATTLSGEAVLANAATLFASGTSPAAVTISGEAMLATAPTLSASAAAAANPLLAAQGPWNPAWTAALENAEALAQVYEGGQAAWAAQNAAALQAVNGEVAIAAALEAGTASTVATIVVASVEAFYLFDAVFAFGQYLIYGDLPLCIGIPLEQRFLLCENPTTTGSVSGHSDTLQTQALDPNFISGPAGFGPDSFIAGDSTIPYLIGFENKPTANAPAQEVVITETLDLNLDLSTFRLGDFGFGNVTLHVPDDEDRQVYRRRIDASTTLGIYIDVNAALNPQTRVVTWTFTSIDPHTLDLPLDPGIGFLPPNRTPPEGDGWVTYFVEPKAGLASGTPVAAQASVVFDTNAPVATNVYVNLLDTTAPTSHVSALPATESSSSFTVNWSGTDGAGSGIASFDVFMSKDGGAFAPFITGTNATSAVFQGATGQTYGFYSLATDNLGFREATKTVAEATTSVGAACANDISAQVQVTRSGYGYDLKNGRFVQTVTIKNASGSVIAGPISLVLDSLSSNATLFNLSGATVCAVPAGSPYINIAGDLNPGASVSVTLQFTNPTKAGITYATRVLSGSAPR